MPKPDPRTTVRYGQKFKAAATRAGELPGLRRHALDVRELFVRMD